MAELPITQAVAPARALPGRVLPVEPAERTSLQALPAPLSVRSRPWLMLLTLMLSDLLTLAAVGAAAVLGRWLLSPILGWNHNPVTYVQLWPALGLFLAGYAAVKLYPGAPLAAADELRRLTTVTSFVFLGLGAATFMTKEGDVWSRSVLLMAWPGALIAVPASRATVRMILAPCSWWGYAVMVLGNTPTAARVIHALQVQPELGLKPVAVVGEPHEAKQHVHGVPVIGGLRRARGLAQRFGVQYGIVAMPHLPPEHMRPLLERLSTTFHHLIVVPGLVGFSSLWVSGVDLGGTLGLEVRHRLLDPGRRALKRVLDLTLIILAIPLLLPLVGLIIAAIKLDSPGPALFAQYRIGLHGRYFRAWKFRTMVKDADKVLEQALASDPALRAEWEADQKLRDDPRITRVGRWLRRTSLDELPQLWNVLRGEMSLVGPRPIVDEEVPRYGETFNLVKKVLPGITGIWQVSGRNDLTYEERVRLDAYYVRNWSVWLDLHLLGRTVLAVLLCRGAY